LYNYKQGNQFGFETSREAEIDDDPKKGNGWRIQQTGFFFLRNRQAFIIICVEAHSTSSYTIGGITLLIDHILSIYFFIPTSMHED